MNDTTREEQIDEAISSLISFVRRGGDDVTPDVENILTLIALSEKEKKALIIEQMLEDFRFIIGNYIEYYRQSLPVVSELESRIDECRLKWTTIGEGK